MAKLCRNARFVQEPVSCTHAIQVACIDDFERGMASQMGVEGFVGDAHGPASQFPGFAVVGVANFVVAVKQRDSAGRREVSTHDLHEIS